MSPKAFDLVIVGGGMVGTALAASLSASPFARHLRIALVEAGDLYARASPVSSEDSPVFSNRVASVTPASVRLLERVGAWQRIPESRKKRFTQMKVWDASGNGSVGFSAPATHATSAIGHIVENDWIKQALTESLGQNVTVFNGARVEDIISPDASDSHSNLPIVRLKDVDLQTRLLVGADGLNSLARQYAGIESSGWDYPQKALVATLHLASVEGIQNDVAYQRFLPDGPIAVLPLSASMSSLVWSTSPSNAAKLSQLSDKDFATFVDIAFRNPVEDLTYFLSLIQADGRLPRAIDLASEASWGRERVGTMNASKIGLPPKNTSLPTVTSILKGSRAGFPLRFYLSDRYVSEKRVALVGDAAHTIHPLAGQGLNLGLLDVATLSKVIEEGVQAGADIGNIHTLQNYASDRFTPNLGMMVAVDSIGRLFRSDFTPVVWARSFGMNLAHSFPGIKELAMKAASTL